ncbi:tRNA (adenine(22)-N(1))-methyltransferase [Peribacillus alkalitolerans]|uniref:tRNA (adenine(22)-N(1))-methyltransferase n=1 Tax=Peribacillus alkalitolerans TaxID=1550385 RepID=UPI0013D3CEDA|nr:tRNA (adenine(22)-N(1))-methyltransferase TrmK [Peribacillus alkalitolerans]
MNIEKLSKRLEAVASYIPSKSILADIGSDHAYLPCYAVINGLVLKAIAGEVVEGPYQSARNQVLSAGLENKIEVRKGDGLDVLNPGEATTVTIAGMGGPLIASILERGKDKLEKTERLILQPNIHAISIRQWLLSNGWQLIKEQILEEDGKIYEVLVAEKGNPDLPYQENKEAALLMGPFLLKEMNSTFVKKWDHEKNHWLQILKQLELSGESEGNQQKKQEILSKISMVEEALK